MSSINSSRFSQNRKARRLKKTAKYRNSEISSFYRSLLERISLDKLVQLGLFVINEDGTIKADSEFYTLFQEKLLSVEEAMITPTSSLKTQNIKEHIKIILDALSGLFDAIEGASKAPIEPNHSAGITLLNLAKIIPDIRKLPQVQMFEEGAALCVVLLKPENKKHLTAIAQVAIVQNIAKLISDAQSLVDERSSEKVSTSCEELREDLEILYNYLVDKVESKANGESSTEDSIAFIGYHNSKVDEISATYNMRMGQIHSNQDTVILATSEDKELLEPR